MRGSLMCPSRGNPHGGDDGSSQLQDDLLTLLEAAGVVSAVNDQIVDLVAAWERENIPFGEAPPRASQADFSPRLAPGPCQGATFNCDGEWHSGYDGRDPYRERCPRATLSALRPVQEEGVGEDNGFAPSFEAMGKMAGALRSKGDVNAANYLTGAGKEIIRLRSLLRRSEASPPSLGVEELRELSEKATPGLFSVLALYEDGPFQIDGGSETVAKLAGPDWAVRGERGRNNAAFIVACVNYARAVLSRVSGGV